MAQLNSTNVYGSLAVTGDISESGTQLSSKYAPISHTHNYAGSSSAGGAATSANKLNTNAGSASNPVYFSSGVPVACTYSLNKTVPSDAVFTDTTYESKAAASGGTAVSLVTTGEKYTWNNKSNLTIGTTATTAAAGNHTHSTSIAASSGTNQITLSANTKYSITAGGTSYTFTTPPNVDISGKADKASITAGTAGTSSATSGSTLAVPYVTMNAQGIVTGYGTHTHTVTGFATSGHTHTTSIAGSSGTNQITLSHGSKYSLTAGGTSYIFTMPSESHTVDTKPFYDDFEDTDYMYLVGVGHQDDGYCSTYTRSSLYLRDDKLYSGDGFYGRGSIYSEGSLGCDGSLTVDDNASVGGNLSVSGTFTVGAMNMQSVKINNKWTLSIDGSNNLVFTYG